MPMMKKNHFYFQIDNIHQNNAKVSLYAFLNYFVQLDEIKLEFAQTGNFYNNDENKYFFVVYFHYLPQKHKTMFICVGINNYHQNDTIRRN